MPKYLKIAFTAGHAVRTSASRYRRSSRIRAERGESVVRINIHPLSVNQAWQGRRFKTKLYTAYERELMLTLPTPKMIKGSVEAHYKFYIKNYGNTDGDNLVKCLQDILVKKGYIEDDRKIVKYTIEKIKSDTDYIEFEFTSIIDRIRLAEVERV